MIRKLAGLFAVFATLTLAGCGYNDLQRQDEGIKAAWSEVLNQYQRRADLVPNLVNTVKGYAAQEADVLTAVTNARANVGAIKATPELVNDPAAFAKFQAAQSQLTSALSRLLVVGKLSEPEVRCAVPRLAVATRRYREPDHRRAQTLHRRGADLQLDGPLVPDQLDGDAVQDGGQAELHRGKRGRDQHAAQGGFRQESGAAGRASACAQESMRQGC